jgi:hypothetical protein
VTSTGASTIHDQETPWRFDPWNLGEDVSLGGLKLLVVGESHYREGYPDSAVARQETQDVVRKHGVGLDGASARSPLFSKVAAMLKTDDVKGADVWQSIYFYNYFQRVMDTPRDPPTKQDYEASVPAFDAVLRAIRPDAVLIISARLWKKIKNECVPADNCALGRIYNFTAGNGSIIPGAHTHHPSAPKPFDVDGWRQRVRDFLQHVQREKDSHA